MAGGVNIGEAIIEFIGDSSKLSAEMKHADKEGKNFVAQMSIGLKGIGDILIPGGIALAIAKIGHDAIETGTHLHHMSEQTGTSVEDLTRMAYAGSLADVSLDSIGNAMTRLARQMAKGEDEMGKPSMALQKLGLSARDTTTGKLKPLNEMMLEISERFNKMPDGPKKLALAYELFGRGAGREMISVLAGGREEMAKLFDESDKLGYTMSGDTAAQLEEYNKAIKRTEAGLQGLGRQITLAVLPGVEQMIDTFGKDFPANAEASISVAEALRRVWQGVVTVFDFIVTSTKAMWVTFGYAVDGMIQQAEVLVTALGKLKNPLNPDNWEANAEAITELNTNSIGIWKAQYKGATEDVDKMMGNMLERTQKSFDQIVLQKKKAAAKTKEVGGDDGPNPLTDAEKEAIAAVKESIAQREIEIAQIQHNWSELMNLKDALIQVAAEKLRIKHIPEPLIQELVRKEEIKNAEDFLKIMTDLERAGQDAVNGKLLEIATTQGLTSKVREYTQAQLQSQIAQMKERGIAQFLIDEYERLATEAYQIKHVQDVEAAQTELVNFQKDIERTMTEYTATEAEKARQAVQDKLDQRLQDLQKFLATHKEYADEVHHLEEAAVSAYYDEMRHLDTQYGTDFQSTWQRIRDRLRMDGKSLAESIGSLSDQILTTAEDNLTDTFVNTLELNFDKARASAKKFLSDLLGEIIKFVVRQEILKFLQILAGWGGGGQYSWGATAGGQTGSIVSGIIGGSSVMNGGHNADGAIFSQPTVGLFAERGPEAIVPLGKGALPLKMEGGDKPIDIHQRIVIGADIIQAGKTSPNEVMTIVKGDYFRNGDMRRTIRARERR